MMSSTALIFLVCIVMLVATLIALGLWWRNSESRHLGEIEQRDVRIKELSERLARVDDELARERIEHVRTQAERDAISRSNEEMHRERAESEKQLKSEFRNLAQEILTEHQANLREANRDSIDSMLRPFKENITEFRERVERIYAHENEQRGALKNELDNLMKLNQMMTSSAANLTDALKGNSKVQGDWGEVYLETILDSTGLVRGIHYHVQQNIKGDEGQNLRPDVILSLPEERSIVIDSKVSLTAYLRYTKAEAEAERRQALSEHVQSVRKHVQELAVKGYEKHLASPDFVVMFIPTEPAFLEAIKADSQIWADAYARKVIISSPTNLFALLKMVADMWRRDAQSKNQAEIVKQSKNLYDQLVAFCDSLEGVGAALDKAKGCYDDAYKRMHTGNNNIIRLGERLKKLGLPTEKRHSSRLLSNAELDDEEA